MSPLPEHTGISPLQQLQQLREDMDRFLSSALGRGEAGRAEVGWTPAMDVVERSDEYLLTAELPGMKKEDLSVDVEDNTLSIHGEKREEREEKEEKRHLVERRFGSFTRRFPLPHNVDPNRIKAQFRNGVLTIHMPKTEEARGRSITVEGGE